MGVYFEYNSFNNSISNSHIADNGFRDKDTGDWVENFRESQRDKREGVAIDASQNNVISNSTFSGNALTGVTLYKNCGERGIRREWGASYNTIIDSTFSDGIHVASRMDRDLSEWSCVDPYVLRNKFVEDDAEFNVLENITLQGNAKIYIQDDNNTLRNITGGTVRVFSKVREELGLPIIGTDSDVPISSLSVEEDSLASEEAGLESF